MNETWNYELDSEWSSTYPDCGGRAQSPIDLHVGAGIGRIEPDMQLQYRYIPASNLALVNRGHSVVVDGNFGHLDLSDGIYDAKQLDFHFPSEHTISGHQMSGEMHIVHQRRGATGVAGIAVVAVLLKLPQEGDVNNQSTRLQRAFFLNLGLAKVPQFGQAAPTPAPDLDLTALDDILSGHYWNYAGSLTVPPCSEKVKWFVMATPTFVDPSVVMSFKQRFPSPMNARPIQALNGREPVWSARAI
jgi:carbonic anhydrase